MAPNEPAESIAGAGRSRLDRLGAEKAAEVEPQAMYRFVAAVSLGGQRLEGNPIEIALDLAGQAAGIGAAELGQERPGVTQGVEPGAGREWSRFANEVGGSAPGPGQHDGIAWQCADQNFVENDSQAVDIASGIEIELARFPLFRAHVGDGADRIVEVGGKGSLTQPPGQRLGDSEVDDLGHRLILAQRHHDVGGLEVAVDDAFLVGVVDRAADIDHQPDACAGVEALLIAEVGQRNSRHILHGVVRATLRGGAGVVHPGDVGVVHDRQGLALGLEAADEGFGIEAGLQELEGDAALDRLELFGLVDQTHPSFAQKAKDPVMGNVGDGVLTHPGKCTPGASRHQPRGANLRGKVKGIWDSVLAVSLLPYG